VGLTLDGGGLESNDSPLGFALIQAVQDLVPWPPEDVPVGQTLEVLAKMAEVFAPTS